jgi:cyclic pyranopterin phosphate synthase
MPREVFDENYRFLRHDQLLTFEEIARLAKIFAAQGIEKIRLTGGEPLLRRNIERLIEMLAAITLPNGKGIELTLTTNASLLAKKARTLKDAGLARVPVSLAALDDAPFRAMTDADFPVAKVLEGIAAADAAGLAPVKINMVVKRGVNEHSILPMARRFKDSGHVLRFIEFMDVGATNGWRMNDVIASRDIIRMIGAHMPIEPLDPNYPGEVAERWRYRDGAGEIGVISSVTQAFCRSCTRARISTEGMLYTCLFATSGYDFRALLREGKSDLEIRAAIAAVWGARDDRYSEIRTAETAQQRKIEMSYIGG